MNQLNFNQKNHCKTKYEEPQIELIRFSCTDIITASVSKDENQGEWDPQSAED